MTFPSRRRRRRRWIGVVIAVGILVALVFAVGGFRSDRQLAREYVDAAMVVVDGERDAAARFASMVVDLENVDRPVMVEVLDELAVEASDLTEQLASADPPPGSLTRAHLFLEIAAARWRAGITSTRDALLTLTESPIDEVGRAMLSQGFIDLRVGDSAFQGFEKAMGDADSSLLTEPIAPVRFVPEDDEELFSADSVVRRLFASPDLEPTTNLAVADIKLDPTPVGQEGGIPVVPWSETLSADATVANRGNVDAGPTSVRLSLVSNEGDVFEAEQQVEILEAGAATAVTFSELTIDPGKLYEVVVLLTGEDDEPIDDQMSFVFIMNADE